MASPAIDVIGVSKIFRVRPPHLRSWKARLAHVGRMHYEEFWALREIDIRVEVGETVGILGHNGSGKSTLLKCISGIFRPSSGCVSVNGRLAALLELGAGFHPDLTGRENIYLNGSILGLRRRNIERLLDDIVAFAELEQFIDDQVKHYSSGMHARLGFAIAVNVDPHILLIDEVLTVGDEAFQRKCFDRIGAFQREGRTIAVVSHSPDQVRALCDRGIVMESGRVIFDGESGAAVGMLRESLARRSEKRSAVPAPEAEEQTSSLLRIIGGKIDRRHLAPGDALEVELHFETSGPLRRAVFGIEVHNQAGISVYGTNTGRRGMDLGTIEGTGTVHFRFPAVALRDGAYRVGFAVTDGMGGPYLAQLADAVTFRVSSPSRDVGIADLHPEISLALQK